MCSREEVVCYQGTLYTVALGSSIIMIRDIFLGSKVGAEIINVCDRATSGSEIYLIEEL